MIEIQRIPKRLAIAEDLPRLEELLCNAKQQMAKDGVTRWTSDYPNREHLLQDITKQQLWVFGDAIKAMVVLEKQSTLWHVKRLVVDARFSGDGIASSILETIKQSTMEANVTEVHICTNHTNLRMIHLIQQQSFSPFRRYHAQDRESLGEFIEFSYSRFVDSLPW